MLTRGLGLLLMSGIAWAAQADAGASAQTAGAAKNVVLVHGAFADGSSWNGVIADLQARGYKVTSVQNPLTTLEADVAATQRALAMQDGPTVLVGHSWGGTVITEAGDDPKVSALVYVAALAPDVDEDFGAVAGRFPQPPVASGFRASAGFVQLSEEAFLRDFAPDVDPKLAKTLHAGQGPITETLFGSRTKKAAWKAKPSWYALSTKDRVVVPELQQFYADRMKATTVKLDASHVSLVSQPKAVAEVIASAAEGRR